MKLRPVLFFGTILVVAIIAAVVGALVADNALDRYAETLEDVGINVPTVTNVKPPSLPGSYHEAVAAIVDRSDDISLPVINIRDAVHSAGIVESKRVSSATTLTSDGWMLVSGNVYRRYGDSARVLYDREPQEIVNWVRDPDFDVVFAKVDVSQAQVADLSPLESLSTGSLAFVVSHTAIYPRAVVDVEHYENERSARNIDTTHRTILLDEPVSDADGAVVVDAAGSVIGFLQGADQVVPHSQVLSVFEDVLAGEGVERESVGLSVTDLSRVIREEGREGLLVVGVRAGAFLEGGVLVDDVIVRIDGRGVDEAPIEELLWQKGSGDVVSIKVLRDGVEEDLSVTM